ncbi:MAG: hypothetical protein LBD24_06270 [Spirochaetaceae bacterium]|nr:hypothetical protein [Spirochaetaceae bacterium]
MHHFETPGGHAAPPAAGGRRRRRVIRKDLGGLRKERKDVGRRASPHPTPARDAPRPEAGGDCCEPLRMTLMEPSETARSVAAPKQQPAR